MKGPCTFLSSHIPAASLGWLGMGAKAAQQARDRRRGHMVLTCSVSVCALGAWTPEAGSIRSHQWQVGLAGLEYGPYSEWSGME